MLRAGLWNYLREDITYSLINEYPLKIHVGAVDLTPYRDDDYGNQMTLLLARIVNAAFLDNYVVVEGLREAVVRWHSSLPFQSYYECDEGWAFPKIRMIQDCHGNSTLSSFLQADHFSCCHALLSCSDDPLGQKSREAG